MRLQDAALNARQENHSLERLLILPVRLPQDSVETTDNQLQTGVCRVELPETCTQPPKIRP